MSSPTNSGRSTEAYARATMCAEKGIVWTVQQAVTLETPEFTTLRNDLSSYAELMTQWTNQQLHTAGSKERGLKLRAVSTQVPVLELLLKYRNEPQDSSDPDRLENQVEEFAGMVEQAYLAEQEAAKTIDAICDLMSDFKMSEDDVEAEDYPWFSEVPDLLEENAKHRP